MEGGRIPFALAPVNVVVGHYGAGKTNFALNLALDAAAAGAAVTLADMDVVNPYFRSSERADLLKAAGVRLIAPVFGGAGTALDVPSLTGELPAAVGEAYAWEREHGATSGTARAATDAAPSGAGPRPVVIVDAGGDDVGATALARFAPAIARGPHEVLFVANAYRNLTQEAPDAVAILREIEAKCRLRATAVVNNSHLQDETTIGQIVESVPFAREVCREAALPLRCTTVPMSAIQRENVGPSDLERIPESYPVRVLVAPPWA